MSTERAIQLQFSETEPIRLTIPENRLGEGVPIKLLLSISNQTEETIKIALAQLIPELVDTEDFSLPKQNAIEFFRETITLSPTSELWAWILLTLFWQGGRLCLKITFLSEDIICSISPLNEWLFEGLSAQSYRLVFSYHSEERERYPLIARRELELLKPLDNNPQAVQIEGIEFETILPNTRVNLPQKSLLKKILQFSRILQFMAPIQPAPNITLQIGLRIKNNTSQPALFNFENLLIPDFLIRDRLLNWEAFSLHPEDAPRSYFPVILPGDQIIFYPEIIVFWEWGQKFRMYATAKNGCYLTSDPIEPGMYRVRFNYKNALTSLRTENKSTKLT